MSVHVRSLMVLIGAAVLVLPACGAGDADTEVPTPAPAWSQGAVPTPTQLASVLLTDGDLPGQWSTPRAVGHLRALPQASAESIQAADGLTLAGRRPTRPDPRRGHRHLHREPVDAPIITVDEWLLAEDPTQVEATFTALRDGIEACDGPSSMTADGVVGTAERRPAGRRPDGRP